jgi:predicted GNAT superfamily acetyltransferase
MSDQITIRRAESYDDYQACQEAQRRAWGITSDGYVVPVATMVGAQLHGGLVLGAFLPDGSAAGLSFAFLGRLDGRLCLYSQLTGVRPEHQARGIGARLKQVQWEFARDTGIGMVVWAFDPLQAGNAHFNLERLGVTIRHFIDNMYGPRTDALNAGAPTDRLIAQWSTTERPDHPPLAIDGLPPLIATRARPDGLIESATVDDRPTADRLLLEIPAEIVRLRQHDPALAEGWRRAVRDAFTAAFAAGYVATRFARQETDHGRRCFYVLERGG